MKAYDIKGKTVGTVGGGRIAYEVMKRLKVCPQSHMLDSCLPVHRNLPFGTGSLAWQPRH